MGACFDEMELDGKLSTRDVESRFESHQRECAEESGNSYSGRLNMCNGLKFATHKTFASYSEAAEYLNEKCQKWENAIAVQYLVSNPVKRDDAKSVKLSQSVQTLRTELQTLERRQSEGMHAKLGTLEFIKCGVCKSRLDTRFRSRTLKCPVCDSSFLSKTELKKRETLKSKIQNAEKKLSEHLQGLQVKADTKPRATRWLIGGVCSS